MGQALGLIIIGRCTGSAEADGFQGASPFVRPVPAPLSYSGRQRSFNTVPALVSRSLDQR